MDSLVDPLEQPSLNISMQDLGMSSPWALMKSKKSTPRQQAICWAGLYFIVAIVIMAALAAPVRALVIPPPNIVRDVEDEGDVKSTFFWLPYAFAAESLGLAYGVTAVSSGWPQEQVSMFSAVMGSSNDSYAVVFYGGNLQLPVGKRLFVDTTFSIGRYTTRRAYIGRNPDYPDERAGSNDSSQDDYIEEKGWDSFIQFRFKYVLPMGHGRDHIINTFRVKDGLLVSGAAGGHSWNPLESGRTMIEFMPFFREGTFDFEIEHSANNTSGFELALAFENTDFFPNPSKGYNLRLALSRDPDVSDSRDTWTFVEGEFSKYFSLGKSEKFRHRVLALNAWTAVTPTWEEEQTAAGVVVRNAPPYYMGANLGGFWRMKGYPQYRFHDKAAIYYSAEIRAIPRWQPLNRWIHKIKLLRTIDVDWWQIVGFAELGRVAETWTPDELHSDMKWDLGVGFRFMIQKSVLRLDTAYSDEGWNVWAMVGHPF